MTLIMTTTKTKRGAPKGNVNRLKHGGRLGENMDDPDIQRLVVGVMPKALAKPGRAALAYRRNLEAAVLEIKGEVNLVDAHEIDLATGAELHQAVCRYLIREKIETMPPSDLLKCSEGMLKAKERRNLAIRRLGLDDQPVDKLRILYSPSEAPDIAPSEPDDTDPIDEPSEPTDPSDGESRIRNKSSEESQDDADPTPTE